jgi:hypothetical protein
MTDCGREGGEEPGTNGSWKSSEASLSRREGLNKSEMNGGIGST